MISNSNPGLIGDIRTEKLDFLDVNDRSQEKRPELKPSEFTEKYIYVEGKPFNSGIGNGFDGRHYLRPIYDGEISRLLLKCARQVEKSTTLGNRSISRSTMIPFHKTLYVTPTAQQTSRFSADRLSRPMKTSPPLAKFQARLLVDNIMFKEFHNHATITLAYAYHSADRIRGIPTDDVYVDEYQDILADHVPVIEEAASHSINPSYWYAGTPKSLSNSIEYLWENLSTKNEWVVPCEHHIPKVWNILSLKSIGKKGPICSSCGNLLDTTKGQWQITGDKDARVRGYHISQLMVPWVDWEDILYKLKKYPLSKFYNEVLGLSFDSGFRPLTRVQLKRNCHPKISNSLEGLRAYRKAHSTMPMFLGIDWGTGDVGFTEITVSAYLPSIGRLGMIYTKRFQGEEAEPVLQLKLIKDFIKEFRIDMIGTDWGFGHYQNDELKRAFGKRVVTYQYAHSLSQPVRWEDGHKRYMVNRTAVMSAIFNAIKRGVFWFPNEEDFLDEYGVDFLNIFSEYSEASRSLIYDHPQDRPDDTFHSFLYSVLVSMIQIPRHDILNPEAPIKPS